MHEYEELSSELNEVINDLLEDYDPLAVASLLVINAFTIFGHTLSEESYKEVMLDIFKESEKFVYGGSRTLH
jgi:hypothetical protein